MLRINVHIIIQIKVYLTRELQKTLFDSTVVSFGDFCGRALILGIPNPFGCLVVQGGIIVSETGWFLDLQIGV